ncbi:MAG: winged helix-turn-helix domain-containing protein [Nitrososphaerota archaeon]|nr:winged helix-turn-helix domain-containing protein [Nitrososphaerota archaeon]
MSKGNYHPKAFLLYKRNVSKGLLVRTKIILSLEHSCQTARKISEMTNLKYSTILHHLRMMEKERIVAREAGKPNVWTLTGIGQKRLTEI